MSVHGIKSAFWLRNLAAAARVCVIRMRKIRALVWASAASCKYASVALVPVYFFFLNEIRRARLT